MTNEKFDENKLSILYLDECFWDKYKYRCNNEA